MKRRKFIAVLGGAAAWPLVASAQQSPERLRKIGILMVYAEDDAEGRSRNAAFLQALEKLGWSIGRNLRIDYRWGASDISRIRTHAKELAELTPDVLITHNTPALMALREAAPTTPIVFATIVDPIGSGFIDNLARPGGNITGFVNVDHAMGGKWLEILKEIAPDVSRASLIFNPETAPYYASYTQPFEAAGSLYAMAVRAVPVRNAAQIEGVIAPLAGNPAGGLVVIPDIFMINASHRELIISLSARYRIPAIYPYRFMAAEGGLVSYGVDAVDLHRRAADYVDRILRGAKPGDLPVQAPVKFELVVNLKTAKALGLDVSPMLLARADEVIE